MFKTGKRLNSTDKFDAFCLIYNLLNIKIYLFKIN